MCLSVNTMAATAVRTVTVVSSDTVRSVNVKTKHTIRLQPSAKATAVRKDTRATNSATTVCINRLNV